MRKLPSIDFHFDIYFLYKPSIPLINIPFTFLLKIASS